MVDEFQHGEIIIVMARNEVRGLNGRLKNPPQMLVFISDGESDDDQTFQPIQWSVAETLAPEKYRRACADLFAIRSRFDTGIADFKPNEPVEHRIGQVFFQLPKVNHAR